MDTVGIDASEVIHPTLRRSKRLKRQPPRLQLHQHMSQCQSSNALHTTLEQGNDGLKGEEVSSWIVENDDPRERRGKLTPGQPHQEIQQVPEAGNSAEDEDKATHRVRKPWETLVIGASLGDNLSKIEYKHRQILQQRFILAWSVKNEPGSIDAQQSVLDELVKEKAAMEDNEENNLPADQIQAKTRIADRLKSLCQALERSQCLDESDNIKAAIAGYKSGEIECSTKFTLIYAGKIVDTCPSYSSFSSNREARLDAYFEVLGPGWLWHEPPLVGPGANFQAKKGFCLQQGGGTYDGLGEWPMLMRFVVDENKVRRLEDKTGALPKKSNSKSIGKEASKLSLRSATFKVVLDSGATLPFLSPRDLKHLGIDVKKYSAQGVLKIHTVNGTIVEKVYELGVGMGPDLEDEGWRSSSKGLGWPHETGILGGLCPVVIPAGDDFALEPQWQDRLSGVLPFKACYMSAAPTTSLIWLGENRKDVLGAKRFPPYQRYDTEYVFNPGYPPEFEEQRSVLGTPEAMIFFHRVPGSGCDDREFIDTDGKQAPGKTTWSYVVDDTIVKEAEFGPGSGPVEGVAKFTRPEKSWRDKWRKKSRSKQQGRNHESR